MSSSVQWTKKKDIHINVNIVDLFKLKRMRTRPRDQTGVQHNITAFLQIACFFWVCSWNGPFCPVTLRFVTLRYQCFSQKILLEGQSGPWRSFLGGQIFRKGTNKLKATEGKNASGYQGKWNSLLGSMIKFNSKCFLKGFYSIKFLLNQILVWRICTLQENNP